MDEPKDNRPGPSSRTVNNPLPVSLLLNEESESSAEGTQQISTSSSKPTENNNEQSPNRKPLADTPSPSEEGNEDLPNQSSGDMRGTEIQALREVTNLTSQLVVNPSTSSHVQTGTQPISNRSDYHPSTSHSTSTPSVAEGSNEYPSNGMLLLNFPRNDENQSVPETANLESDLSHTEEDAVQSRSELYCLPCRERLRNLIQTPPPHNADEIRVRNSICQPPVSENMLPFQPVRFRLIRRDTYRAPIPTWQLAVVQCRVVNETNENFPTLNWRINDRAEPQALGNDSLERDIIVPIRIEPLSPQDENTVQNPLLPNLQQSDFNSAQPSTSSSEPALPSNNNPTTSKLTDEQMKQDPKLSSSVNQDDDSETESERSDSPLFVQEIERGPEFESRREAVAGPSAANNEAHLTFFANNPLNNNLPVNGNNVPRFPDFGNIVIQNRRGNPVINFPQNRFEPVGNCNMQAPMPEHQVYLHCCIDRCTVDPCYWFGSMQQFVPHLQEAHPNHLAYEPIQNIEIDILTLNYYRRDIFIYAFDELFHVHVVYSVLFSRIYASVRYVGAQNNARNFRYTFRVGDENTLERGMHEYCRDTHFYLTHRYLSFLNCDCFVFTLRNILRFSEQGIFSLRLEIEMVDNTTSETL